MNVIFNFICSQIILGQEFKGKLVCDSSTKLPIPYATIFVLNKHEGIYADQNGNFIIPLKINDTIKVSAIGYQPKISQGLNDTIFLEPRQYILNEITVFPKKQKEFEIGFIKSRKIAYYTFENNSETLLKIEIPEIFRSYFIKAVKIKCINHNHLPLYRLHIYDQDDGGMPGNELLYKNIIVNHSVNRNGKIDLSKLSLFSDKKVLYIGIETINAGKSSIQNSKNNPSGQASKSRIGITFEHSLSSTFSKSVFFDDKNWFCDHKRFRDPPFSPNPGNLMISLIIE